MNGPCRRLSTPSWLGAVVIKMGKGPKGQAMDEYADASCCRVSTMGVLCPCVGRATTGLEALMKEGGPEAGEGGGHQ